MGGKGGGDSESARFLADAQAANARTAGQLGIEAANRARPLQDATAGIFGNFLNTGQTPGFLDLPEAVTPLTSLSLPALANQQTLMRNQLVNQGIRGGQLQQSLAGNILQGGLQRTGLLQQDALRQEQRDVDRAQLRQRLFGGAADFGSGGISQAFQGLGTANQGFASAAGTLNQQAALQQQRDIMQSQGTGQLLGKGLSTAIGFLPSQALSGTVLGSTLKV